MSITIQKENVVFLDQQQYLVNLYKNTVIICEKEEEIGSFIPKSSFFVIDQPHIKFTPNDGITVDQIHKDSKIFEVPVVFQSKNDNTVKKCKKKRSRKRKSPLNQGEIDLLRYHDEIVDRLKLATSSILNDFKHNIHDYKGSCNEYQYLPKICHDSCNFLQSAKMVSDQLERVKSVFAVCGKTLMYSLKNNCSFSHCIRIKKNCFLFPKKSHLICSDITNLDFLLNDCMVNGKFSCIVMDPPWQNKSVKRSKKYNALSFNDILAIPFDKLCDKSCIIVVWVTNKQMILKWVKESLFSHWNITLIAEWHWVKLALSGEPVFPWDSLHKKPYETILIGCYQYTGLPKMGTFPQKLVICSMPSTVHSHKPPLANVLEAFFGNHVYNSARCLEMFARNLNAGWTSWGNEVLLLQDLSYFERI